MIEAVCTLSALFALGAVRPILGVVVLGLSGWDACFEAMYAMTSTGLAPDDTQLRQGMRIILVCEDEIVEELDAKFECEGSADIPEKRSYQ